MAAPQFMRKIWTSEEVLQLHKLARQNTPAQVIARKLGCSIDAVYVKASREGLSPLTISSSGTSVKSGAVNVERMASRALQSDACSQPFHALAAPQLGLQGVPGGGFGTNCSAWDCHSLPLNGC